MPNEQSKGRHLSKVFAVFLWAFNPSAAWQCGRADDGQQFSMNDFPGTQAEPCSTRSMFASMRAARSRAYNPSKALAAFLWASNPTAAWQFGRAIYGKRMDIFFRGSHARPCSRPVHGGGHCIRHRISMVTPPPPPIPPSDRHPGGGDGEDGKGIRAVLLQLLAYALTTGRAVLRAIKAFPLLVLAGLVVFVRPLRRAMRTLIEMLPILIRLKLFQYQRFESEAARLKAQGEMDKILADRFAQFIGSMRGAYIKSAQVLATCEPPIVRPIYIKKLEPMFYKAPIGRPWREVRRQIDRELRAAGRRGGLNEVFSHFEHKPIGTASVGQVHRAVLRESGKVVAVKVQYPDAQNLILTDLFAIIRYLRVLGRKAEADSIQEVRGQVSLEFDYVAEGRTLNAVANFFSSGSSALSRRIMVPQCQPELCTRRLLVMDFLEGRNMKDAIQSKVASLESMPGVLRLPGLFVLRHDTLRKLRTLIQAQAAQVFSLGTFSADPHPGNIFLTSHRGRLGLLDFGCSKTLSPTQRATLARLIVALAEQDEDGIFTAAVEMGMRTKHMNRSVIVQFVTQCFDYDVVPVGPLYVMDYLNSIDEITAVPDEYMLAARSSILLRCLSVKLRGPERMAKAWEGEARRYLRNFEQQ